MISLFKLSRFFLITVLSGALFYCYKSHQSSKKYITNLESYQFSDQRFLVRSPYGFPFLSLEKSIDPQESPTVSFIFEKLIPEKAPLLHLGAQSGLHSILIKKTLEKKGKIFAFEGHPKHYALLKENKYLHRMGRAIKTFPLIPAAKKESLSICFEANYPTLSDTDVSTAYEQGLKGKDCQTVSLDRLDDLKLPKIGFVLVENTTDVSHALQGALHLLEKSGWPPILIFPNSILTQNKNKSWTSPFKKAGYYFYRLRDVKASSFKIDRVAPKDIASIEPCYLFFSKDLLPISIEK
jgi:FkbM family methyltransferase